MINLIIAYDSSSPDLGTNCSLCSTHLLDNIDSDQFIIYQFDGDACDSESLQKTITSLNESSFVFIAYCHGSDDGLMSHHNGNYINVANSYYFSSSLFYTNACHSGKSIKQALIQNKCKVFVGYDDEVKLPNDEKDDMIFIQCENHAIIEFLNSEKAIGACVEEMKDKYTKTYQDLVNQGSIVLAARLLLNRDCLSIDGDITVNKMSLLNN